MPVPEKNVGGGGGAGAPPKRELPRWKKVLLASAAFAVLLGAGFRVYTLVRSGNAGGQKVVTDQRNLTNGLRDAGGQPFLPDDRPPADPGDEPRPEDGVSNWSPLLLKGGFSFFVGFAIGYALRTFFRISAVVVGLVLLIIFGLAYAGVLDVDWSSIEGHFNRIVGSMKDEATSFKDFIAQSLPSVSLAGLGLFTGFKKN